MGKVIAKKIRGMNLWAKVTLVTFCTLLMSTFLYEGWYKPLTSYAASKTYYVEALTSVNVGTPADGSGGATTMTTLADVTVTVGNGNTNRAYTDSVSAPTGTIRWRIQPAAAFTGTNQEYFRAYTPKYTANTTISANATAYADFYNGTAGTSIVAEATLYEYNDTTGIVGAAKGTASYTGNATDITNRQTMNNVSFGNTQFTVANGNRLMVIYSFDSTGCRPRMLWGQAASATPSGYQSFTVDEVPVATDTTPPTVSSVAVASGTTVNVTFSEAMGTGVTTASNYTLSGTGKGTLAANPNSVALVSGNTYRLTWTAGEMLNGGNITITVANAQDLATNPIGSPNSGTHTGGAIGVAPTVTINQAVGQSDPTSASPVNFTVVFSEAVSGFVASDVTISGTAGGIKTVTISGTGPTYTAAVSGMTTSGTVIATIPASVVTDAAGNNNNASTSTDNSVTYNVAAVNGTTAGPLTFTATSSSITVTAPYTGDANGNNSCVIKWGPTTAYQYTATSSKSGSAYTATINNLNPSTPYYFQATFTDTADGVTGSPVTGTASTTALVSSLMHNNANLQSDPTKNYGDWGAGKDCSWCHASPTTNIKQVRSQIDVPNVGLRPVTFNRITSTVHTVAGVFGDDQRTYAVNASTNICEVCHRKTATTWHRYSSVQVTDKSHNNNADCMKSCHPHSKGFKGSGDVPDHTVPFYATTTGHGTCSGVGCHANSNPAGAYPTTLNADGITRPAPDCRACHKLADPTVATNGCGSCHGALNGNGQPNSNVYPNISGAHTKHVALAQINSNCVYCHNIGGSGGNQDHGPSNHVAVGTVNLGFTTTAINGTVQCNNTYCHSDGTNLVTPATNLSPAWTGGSIANCGGCHGNNAANGSPSYTGTKINSHIQHVTTAGYTCDFCHFKTTSNGTSITSAARHTNKFYNISANTSKTQSFTYSNSTHTCSNSQCHTTPSPVWGSNSAANIDSCTKCHGTPSVLPATDLQKAPTSPATAAHAVHLQPTIGPAVACNECHESVPVANTVNHMNGTKTILYNGPVGVANSTTPSGSYPASCATTWCHGGNTTLVPQNKPTARTAPTWGTTFGTSSVIGDGLGASSTNTGSGRCAKCHGFPPATANHVNANLDGVGTNKKSCNSCHGHVTTAGTFSPANLHINGIIEGGDCLGCHDTGAAGDTTSRLAIKPQFSAQSHHVQGRAVTNADCYQCHMEAPDTSGSPDASFHVGVANSGAAVNLVVWQTNGTRGYVSYTANGKRTSIKKVNDHCLSCHNSTNASKVAFNGFRTDQYSPEARLVPALTKTSILSRYSSTRTIAWSQYNYSSASGEVSRFGTNQKNRTTKALSAHGNAAKNQMPDWSATANGPGEDGNMADYTYKGTSGNRNVFCYDCHNSHGSDAAGVTSSYSSATGRYKGGLLKSTVAGKGGYTVTYKPAGRNITYRNISGIGQTVATSTTNTNIINGVATYTMNPGASICNDCHNDNIQRVNINKPWSINNTYSSSRAIVGYWSTPYFDNYTFASAKRTTYKAGGTVNAANDRRKPMGGHFGSSVSTRSAGHSGEINGLCTPCHDPHGVSNALSTNRDHGVPLLKGTWVTSPYREDKADKKVLRGGGRNVPNLGALGAVPGYHIDQNTFMVTPLPVNGGASATATTRSNQRRQTFRSITILTNMTSAQNGTNMPNLTPAEFAGLCTQCHNQQSLTGASAATTSAPWKSKQRIHQSVSGWASTNGTNSANRVHAYSCAKCHAPHVSRLPRLLVTNCLDVRHFGQVASGGSINSVVSGTTTPGNIHQSTVTSARGAGRFPGGGSRYSGTPTSAQNSGGWWFQTNGATGTSAPNGGSANIINNNNYGSNCHNSGTAGGATYSPANQKWNNKSQW